MFPFQLVSAQGDSLSSLSLSAQMPLKKVYCRREGRTVGRAQWSDTSVPCNIIGIIQGETVESHAHYTMQDDHVSNILPRTAKKLHCPVSKELLQFYSLAFM